MGVLAQFLDVALAIMPREQIIIVQGQEPLEEIVARLVAHFADHVEEVDVAVHGKDRVAEVDVFLVDVAEGVAGSFASSAHVRSEQQVFIVQLVWIHEAKLV